MNCKKYKYKADKQRESWLKNLPLEIKYYHVIGDDKNYIDEENKLFYVKNIDDYNSLPEKVITSFNLAKDYDYIFKTDDDQNLIDEKFFKNLISILTKNNYFYGGHNIRVKDHYSKYYQIHSCLPKKLFLEKTLYCSGRFYFLHKEAVENLLTKKEEISKRYIEDHSIGYFLDDKYKEKVLRLDTEKYFKEF